MRASSRYYLHAAVVQWRSQSVLIVGPSGVGKTTLAVLMALEGGELLGDDSAFVGPEQVWPVAHAVRIDPASLMFHRELAYSIDAEAGEKAIFRELRPQGRPVSADVLFFPTRVTSGGLAAQPMAPATALLGLLAASPFATERRMAGTAQQLAFLAALANRCVSFRISTGPKLLESPSGELAKLARALN